MPLPPKDEIIDLTNVQRIIREALGKQYDHLADLFKDYDEAKQYASGVDVCVYQGSLYRCIADTTGAWTAEAWEKLSNFTVPTGRKNLIVNSNFAASSVVNQHDFDGNWSGLSNGDFGWDKWLKVDASNIKQFVEEGNYLPSTVHTLSGTNVTTAQITSPASGDWEITVPNNADLIQLEVGDKATNFEVLPEAETLAICQREAQSYTLDQTAVLSATQPFNRYRAFVGIQTAMRVIPAVNTTNIVFSIGTIASVTWSGSISQLSTGTEPPSSTNNCSVTGSVFYEASIGATFNSPIASAQFVNAVNSWVMVTLDNGDIWFVPVVETGNGLSNEYAEWALRNPTEAYVKPETKPLTTEDRLDQLGLSELKALLK